MQHPFHKRLGGKWYIVGAVVCAALFFILMAYRSDLATGGAVSAGKTDWVGTEAVPAKEIWLTISQEGRKIGYAQRTWRPCGGGYCLRTKVFLRINTLGVVQPLAFKTEGSFNGHMALRSFTFHVSSGLFRFVARGTVRDHVLTLHVGPPGEETEREVALSSPLYLSEGLIEGSRLTGLRPGESRTLQVFNPLTMDQRPVRITMADALERLSIGGRSQIAKKISLDFMGARQHAWLGEDGAILKEQGILGIVLEQSTREDALQGILSAESADLTEVAAIEANRRIDDPGSLEEMQLRLIDLDTAPFDLDGGRQRFREGLLRIRRETLADLTEGADIPLGSPFLSSSPLIQSDHPVIVRQARNIVSGSVTNREKAEKIVDWVYRNVKKRPLLSVPNALETLTRLEGDCNEHAVLLAALARASGIPADVEVGLVYLRGRFYYHAWNALYLGKWVTADGTLGQMPADVTHIRFARGALERHADLLGLFGRLRLEIVGTS